MQNQLSRLRSYFFLPNLLNLRSNHTFTPFALTHSRRQLHESIYGQGVLKFRGFIRTFRYQYTTSLYQIEARLRITSRMLRNTVFISQMPVVRKRNTDKMPFRHRKCQTHFCPQKFLSTEVPMTCRENNINLIPQY